MRNLGQQRKLQHKESAYEAFRKDNLKENCNCRKVQCQISINFTIFLYPFIF